MNLSAANNTFPPRIHASGQVCRGFLWTSFHESYRRPAEPDTYPQCTFASAARLENEVFREDSRVIKRFERHSNELPSSRRIPLELRGELKLSPTRRLLQFEGRYNINLVLKTFGQANSEFLSFFKYILPYLFKRFLVETTNLFYRGFLKCCRYLQNK